MELIDLEKLIKTRRSIRQWKKESVPEDAIVKAIEIATWAPNGGNQQNWRFIVVTGKGAIDRIADAVQAKIVMMADWPEAARFGEEVTRWRAGAGFFRAAPVMIAVCMEAYESVADKLLKLRLPEDPAAQPILEHRRAANSGLQSVSAAIAYLLLTLHAQGLGGIWMTGPLVATAEIEEILGVPPGLGLAALIAVGYPAEQPQKTRKAVTEVIEFRR
jgi:nitroreductase